MIDPARSQRRPQRLCDVLLPHHLGKGRGPIFTVESERHEPRLTQESDTPAHPAIRTEPGKKGDPRTRQSSRTLAAFRPWGG